MPGIITLEDLRESIIEIRGQMVLLDSDVAVLYDVETKRINEAVKNNPDKFPGGYTARALISVPPRSLSLT